MLTKKDIGSLSKAQAFGAASIAFVFAMNVFFSVYSENYFAATITSVLYGTDFSPSDNKIVSTSMIYIIVIIMILLNRVIYKRLTKFIPKSDIESVEKKGLYYFTAVIILGTIGFLFLGLVGVHYDYYTITQALKNNNTQISNADLSFKVTLINFAGTLLSTIVLYVISYYIFCIAFTQANRDLNQ